VSDDGVKVLSDSYSDKENNFNEDSWKPINDETFNEAIDRVVATTYLKKDSKTTQINSINIIEF